MISQQKFLRENFPPIERLYERAAAKSFRSIALALDDIRGRMRAETPALHNFRGANVHYAESSGFCL